VIIYSMQLVLILSAALLPYESDLLLFSIYLAICVLIFSFITIAERKGWSAHGKKGTPSVYLSGILERHQNIAVIPYRLLVSGLSLFVVSAAVMSIEVPIDFGLSSLVLFVLLLGVILSIRLGDILYRLLMFVALGFSVYLLSTYPPDWLIEQVSLVYLFFITITILSFATVRIAATNQFQITPLDYLVIIMVIIVSVAPGIEHGASSLVWMFLQIVILFYACELVIQNMKSKFNSFTGAVGLALVLIAFRGLV